MNRSIGAFISRNSRFIPIFSTIALFFVAYPLGAAFYDGMRDPQVFINLFVTSPFLLIAAVGETFVIISGGIDLSVSGLMALTATAAAALLRDGWNPWTVILTMLLMGMVFGTVMGLLITYLKVQPFIVTLAGMWFARGMCYFISDDAVKITDRVFRIIGHTKILIPGLSDPVAKTGEYITPLVVLMMVVFAVAIYVAQYTRFGRSVYAIGGNNGANEHSARLMGLPVDRTKVLVYTLNGFCSALAGLALCIYVSSGHGSYLEGFEMTVIAAVVIGGTMLTGGEGYIFGTLFGVLITVLIQTLIQFNGKLSSWWTSIVVGMLTLVFLGVQSLLAARKSRQMAVQRMGRSKTAGAQQSIMAGERKRMTRIWGAAAVVLAALAIGGYLIFSGALSGGAAGQTAAACTRQPFRQEEAAAMLDAGAVLVYERNGGSNCIDELYSIYPDGRIAGDDGATSIEKQVTPDEVEQLLADITALGWFTEDIFSSSHIPCGQCYSYYVSVSYQGQLKTVGAVDGGTDAPANYWKVTGELQGILPKFTSANP